MFACCLLLGFTVFTVLVLSFSTSLFFSTSNIFFSCVLQTGSHHRYFIFCIHTGSNGPPNLLLPILQQGRDPHPSFPQEILNLTLNELLPSRNIRKSAHLRKQQNCTCHILLLPSFHKDILA